MPCNDIFWPYNWRVITADKILCFFVFLPSAVSVDCKKAPLRPVINYMLDIVLSKLEAWGVWVRVGQFVLGPGCLFRDANYRAQAGGLEKHRWASWQLTLTHWHDTRYPKSSALHSFDSRWMESISLWRSRVVMISLISSHYFPQMDGWGLTLKEICRPRILCWKKKIKIVVVVPDCWANLGRLSLSSSVSVTHNPSCHVVIMLCNPAWWQKLGLFLKGRITAWETSANLTF